MPIQLGPAIGPQPPQPPPSVWQQIWGAFSRASGLFSKMLVILKAIFAFVAAFTQWVLMNLLKAVVVFIGIAIVIGAILWLKLFTWFWFLWACAIGLAVIVRMILPPVVKLNKKSISAGSLAWYPIILMVIVSIFWWPIVGITKLVSAVKVPGWNTLGITTLIILGAVALALVHKYTSFRPFTYLWKAFIHPATFIAVGIACFNYLAWAAAPETWSYINADKRRFWAINIGVWIALCMLLVPQKGRDMQDTKHAIASTLSKWILAMVFAVIAVMVWKANGDYWMFKLASKGVRHTQIAVPDKVPVEIVMRAICECESGCKQFEPDGVTPLKNKGVPGKGIKPSSAFGKYQFLESHREPALKLGFNLNTEAGQDGYTKYRIERYGTKDWEFDEDLGGGRACWEPKLAVLGVGKESFVLTVEAPASSVSQKVVVPRGFKVNWGESESAFVVINENGAMARYDRKNGKIEDLPSPSEKLRFKSLSEEAAVVKLRFTKL